MKCTKQLEVVSEFNCHKIQGQNKKIQLYFYTLETNNWIVKFK